MSQQIAKKSIAKRASPENRKPSLSKVGTKRTSSLKASLAKYLTKFSIWSVKVAYEMQGRLNWNYLMTRLRGQNTIIADITFVGVPRMQIAEGLLGEHGWVTVGSSEGSLTVMKIPKKTPLDASEDEHLSEIPIILAKLPDRIESITARLTRPDFHPLPRWTMIRTGRKPPAKDPKNPGHLDTPYYVGPKSAAKLAFGEFGFKFRVQPANIAALHAEGHGWAHRTTWVLTGTMMAITTLIVALGLDAPFAWLLELVPLPWISSEREGQHLAASWGYSLVFVVLAVVLTTASSKLRRRNPASKKEAHSKAPKFGSWLPIPLLFVSLVMCGFLGVIIRDFVLTRPEDDVYKYTALAVLLGVRLAVGAFRMPGNRKIVASLRRIVSGTFILAVAWVILHIPSWGYLSGLNLGRLASSRDVNDLLPWIPDLFPFALGVAIMFTFIYLIGSNFKWFTPLMYILLLLSVVSSLLAVGGAAYAKGQNLAATGKSEYTVLGYPVAGCLIPSSFTSPGSGRRAAAIPAWVISTDGDQFVYVGREERGKLMEPGVRVVTSGDYSLRILSLNEQEELPKGQPCGSSSSP